MKTILLLSFLICTNLTTMAQKNKPRINHIALSVLDLARSKNFYLQVIGLDTIPEPFHDGRHVWFSIGDHSHLHIIQNPPPLVVPTKNTHICFSVKDMNLFVDGLKKQNIKYEDWPGKANTITTRADGVHQIYFQDPDGYWVEVNDDN